MPTSALAGSACDSYRKSAPRMYELYCSGGAGAGKPAGSTSTFTESFKLNAASLPTENSPYGVEGLTTFLNSGVSAGFPTLGIVKGFHRFGAGVSTAGANTFYSNHLTQRLTGPSKIQNFDETETKKGKFSSLNMGSSFQLWAISSEASLQLGASLRYNQITNTLGGGPAIMLLSDFVTVGFGVSREQVSNTISRADFYSFLVGKRFGSLELEYNFLDADILPNLSAVHVVTANLSVNHLILIFAVRRLNYIEEGYVTQPHFAVQWLLMKHFSLGYLYNYIPGGSSIGAQMFF